MQGAAVVDGTWFVTTSRGRYRLGSVWVGRPGALREHRWQLPVGPEDITYWPAARPALVAERVPRRALRLRGVLRAMPARTAALAARPTCTTC